MNSERLKKLRLIYHSLLEQQQWLNKLSGGNYIERVGILPLLDEFAELNREFPDLVPVFNIDDYGKGDRYNFIGIRSYLGSAIGRLRIAVEETTDNPVTEKRQFNFISNPELKVIIERDYSEAQRAYIAGCWKSVIILCGGVIEAILTDLLLSNEADAKSCKSAPNKSEITRWDFSDIIHVAVELELVSAGIEKLSHPVREYRNLVHPGNELRTKLRFDAEEAKIALEILNILHRDLSH